MNTLRITVWNKTAEGHLVVMEEIRSRETLTARSEGYLQLDPKTLTASLPFAYGQALGKALFAEDLRERFTKALEHARSDLPPGSPQPKPLRVLLTVEDAELRRLHWERLCARIDGKWVFLAGNQETPFSQYLPSLVDRSFPPISPRSLRALLLVASPADLSASYSLKEFDVAGVVDAVKSGMGEIECDMLARVPGAGKPDLPTLLERLTSGRYRLLHIVCHGAYIDHETVLYLPDENGRAVTATDLILGLERLQGGRGLPYFTFLMACQSADPRAEGQSGASARETGYGGLGQRLVREVGLPAVLAMTADISVATANQVAAAFYPALRTSAGGEVDLALSQALVKLGGRVDQTVPAVFSRLGERSLFSNALDERPLQQLAPEEIQFGLQRLAKLLDERAPVLKPTLEKPRKAMEQFAGVDPAGLLPERAAERRSALEQVNLLAIQALEVGFNTLALDKPVPAYDTSCPFPGLLRFDLQNYQFFFGRETVVKTLEDRMAQHPFLAILGLSGSGKSSLALAGLAQRLGAQNAPGLATPPGYLAPGSDPLPQLDAALGRLDAFSEQPRLLIVDQFEELFTLCKDAAAREEFVRRMLAQVGACQVVLTMRADFYGECANFPSLSAAMERHQKLVAPMTAVELRKAMEQQAAAVGLKFEDGLSERILSDVQGEPGAMPLLQHALLTLWQRRHGYWLRLKEYEAFGGIQKAIASTANQFFNALDPARQALVRDIFIRLTRLDDASGTGMERHDTRQRVELSELVTGQASPETVRDLINELETQRLVVRNRNVVEVAHEALIRGWDELGSWLAQDRANIQLRGEVQRAAQEWQAHQRGEDYLVHRTRRLDDALRLLSSGLPLNEQELGYLEACRLAERERLSLAVEAEMQFDGDSGLLRVDLRRPVGEDSSYSMGIQQTNEQRFNLRTQTGVYTYRLAIDTYRLQALNGDEAAQGRYLGEALWPEGTARDLYAEAKGFATSTGRPLSLRLGVSDDYEVLHALPWESLHDPLTGAHLDEEGIGLSRRMNQPGSTPRAAQGLSALAVLVPPDGVEAGAYDASADQERIQAALGDSYSLAALVEGQVSHTEMWARISSGCDVLYLYTPARLQQGEICLWADDSRVAVTVRRLNRWLWRAPRPPRVIVIESNLPLSSGPLPGVSQTRGAQVEQMRMLEEVGVPAVLWLPEECPPPTRVALLRAFFQALVEPYFLSPDRALARARQGAQDQPGWSQAVLFSGLASNPLWNTIEARRESFVSKMQSQFSWIPALTSAVHMGRMLPVLGPGLVEGVLGTQRAAALDLAEHYEYSYRSLQALSLPEAANFISISQDYATVYEAVSNAYRRSIQARFRAELPPELLAKQAELLLLIAAAGKAARQRSPADPLSALARLPLSLYLTTNADRLLLDALRVNRPEAEQLICSWDPMLANTLPGGRASDPGYRPTPHAPLAVSLFGDLSLPKSMVITKNGYDSFPITVSGNPNFLPTYVQRALVDNALALVGYERNSLDFQVVLLLIQRYQNEFSRRYPHLVQMEPSADAAADQYLESSLREQEFQVVWCSVEDFTGELAQAVEKGD